MNMRVKLKLSEIYNRLKNKKDLLIMDKNFLFLHMYQKVCLSVCVSVCVFVSLSVPFCLCVFLLICMCVCLFVSVSECENENENCTILIPKGNSYCRRKSSARGPRLKVSSKGLSAEIDTPIQSPIQVQTKFEAA